MIEYKADVNKYLYDMNEVNDIIETIQNGDYYNIDKLTKEKVSLIIDKLDKFISDIEVVKEESVLRRKETEEEAREYFGEDFVNEFNSLMTELDKDKVCVAIHGTSPESCPSICEEGLRYKSPNLTSTAVQQHMEYGQRDINHEKFSELLNWPHREYKGLVLIGIPYESFYKEGLWNHYQNADNGYSYDYKINPDFIVGYIDVDNKKIVRNPKYSREHDYSGLVHDYDIFREKKDMDNDRMVDAIIESEKYIQELGNREDYSYKEDDREVSVDDISNNIYELIGTFNSIKLGFTDGMNEDRYRSLLEELNYKLDIFKKGFHLLKTEEEVEKANKELEDMFSNSTSISGSDYDFDTDWDDPDLWDDVEFNDEDIKKFY